MTTPDDIPFGKQLKGRRTGLGLSIRAAASQAGFKNHVRWSQVELGYDTSRGKKLHTQPSAEFVIKAAPVVQWNVRSALIAAGFDPDAVIGPPPDPPKSVDEMWTHLTDSQRSVVYNLMRTMIDPEAKYDPDGHREKPPAPRVIFSAEDNPGNGRREPGDSGD